MVRGAKICCIDCEGAGWLKLSGAARQNGVRARTVAYSAIDAVRAMRTRAPDDRQPAGGAAFRARINALDLILRIEAHGGCPTIAPADVARGFEAFLAQSATPAAVGFAAGVAA
jgi:hypothetical protein